MDATPRSSPVYSDPSRGALTREGIAAYRDREPRSSAASCRPNGSFNLKDGDPMINGALPQVWPRVQS